MNALAKAAEDVLRQGFALLSELDEVDYALMVPAPYNASVGRHYRHVVDHFLCLAAGAKSGIINYDRRGREQRLENDLEYAREMTENLIRAVRGYDAAFLDQSCLVQYTVGYGGGEPAQISSVIGRELAFCAGHAVHHYALIRFLCDALGVRVVPEFGIAPSTLKHQAAQVAN